MLNPMTRASIIVPIGYASCQTVTHATNTGTPASGMKPMSGCRIEARVDWNGSVTLAECANDLAAASGRTRTQPMTASLSVRPPLISPRLRRPAASVRCRISCGD